MGANHESAEKYSTNQMGLGEEEGKNFCQEKLLGRQKSFHMKD